MKLTDTTDAESGGGPAPVIERVVTVHNSSPDRSVFTEQDNTDGWIATDTTVELLR